jgi:23S rRNA (cytosine1962-C5)-methyltransferase
LARGYYNPRSKIPVRLLSWDADETIDAVFFARRLAAAVGRRREILGSETTAARLVMSEADQLPGLIVDQYEDFLVVQALTAGMERWLPTITAALGQQLTPRGMYERSHDAVRELEGLPVRAGVLAGAPPPDQGVLFKENGHRFLCSLHAGHKTGYYLDQRDNHRLVGDLARGRRVLDCFSYTGGFSVHAAARGAAAVVSVDASEPALKRLEEHFALNELAGRCPHDVYSGDAFAVLRDMAQSGEQFDLIILDPPKFAASGAQVEKAARGYKDINLSALKMLRPGGLLATYSCSGHISADLFQKIIFGAAADAGTDAQIVASMQQAPDHPVLLSFPESCYLEGLLSRGG